MDADNKQLEENVLRPTSGTLEQEVQKLRDDVRFETRILYIGFVGVFIAVIIYAIGAIYEQTVSYNSLLQQYYKLDAGICHD
jgi:hypothetical protein